MDAAHALLLSGLLLVVIAAVLKRYRIAVHRTREAREMELLEQLAQPSDRMSQVVAASQSTLQAKDDQVGLTAGVALAAHESKVTAFSSVLPRKSQGETFRERCGR